MSGASRLWVSCFVLAACKYPSLPRVAEASDGGQIGTHGAPDAMLTDAAPPIDAAPASPLGFTPLHVFPSSFRTGAPDLILSRASSVDTDALTVNGATSPFFIRQGSYAVLFTGLFAVESGLTIQGSSPLIVVASDHVNITGSIDLAAHGTTPGPGATTTGAGKPGESFIDPRGIGMRASSGGGGGSYGSAGGAGGSENATTIPGGSSGPAYGASPGDPLVGGSPGGTGGFASDNRGGGGGGGLQISSGVAIDVFGTIVAGGGGGVGGQCTLNGGGGGGAGGEILLEAPVVSLQSSGAPALSALGGGGGAGGCEEPTGTPGGNGGDASLEGGGAGGTAGVPHGDVGGAGATVGADHQLVDATAGGGASLTSGGGGGGAGRIWLRYRASSPVPSTSTAPPAVLDPTLP